MNGRTTNETAAPQAQATIRVRTRVEQLERENLALRETIHALLSQDKAQYNDERNSSTLGSDGGGDEDAETGDETDELFPKDPIWDEMDLTFRCTECAWEVVDGLCESCGTEHIWDDVFAARAHHPIPTHPETMHDDLSQTYRGTTPTREVPPFLNVPKSYLAHWVSSHCLPDRSVEYEALISRGATRLMCETFHLEYSEENGIFAWADGDLYSQFAGPQMQKGDFWKIYLGRRILLDEEDLDGSSYIEDLLEEALLFPSFLAERWKTIEESPGIWVTRPEIIAESVVHSDNETDGDVESDDAEPVPTVPLQANTGPVISVDCYEMTDEETDGREEGDEEDNEAEEEDFLTDLMVVDDPGCSWQAGIPDVDWPHAGVAGEIDIQGTASLCASPEPETLNDSDSEPGSDFDSDEVLSGDEDVLGPTFIWHS